MSPLMLHAYEVGDGGRTPVLDADAPAGRKRAAAVGFGQRAHLAKAEWRIVAIILWCTERPVL